MMQLLLIFVSLFLYIVVIRLSLWRLEQADQDPAFPPLPTLPHSKITRLTGPPAPLGSATSPTPQSHSFSGPQDSGLGDREPSHLLCFFQCFQAREHTKIMSTEVFENKPRGPSKPDQQTFKV